MGVLDQPMEQQVFNDRYKIIAKIGSGGMAEVYKAMDTVLDRPVAVKVLHRHFAEDEDFVTRFRREAQAAAGLNHPNIVSIYDWGSQNGTYFIVMELLEGKSLKQYMTAKGIIPPAEAMEIIKKVLSAINFAHKHDIIHRDIKPHNIMLTREGEVKVTDFGIARAGVSTMTQTGTVLGTAHYLSPEQARGQDVGVTSDIYSVGVVLYEMTTGKVPFDGENPVAIALKHVHEIPVRPRELNPDISEDLQTIIAKAMAKNPESRYQSAAEMRNDIMRLMEGMPIVALAPDEQETLVMAPPSKTARATQVKRPTTYQEPPRRRKSRAPMVLLVLFLILGMAGAGWYGYTAGIIHKKMVAVPDIQNKSLVDAEHTLKKNGLKLKKTDEMFSNTIAAGLVIQQKPDPGEKREEGSVVEVTVSKGQEMTTIPDVTGSREYKATSRLIEAGLKVGDSNYENSDEIEQGSVIRTEPAAGESVPARTPVKLVISKGQASSVIPDAFGKPLAEAKSTLEQAGFMVTTLEMFSEDVDKGNVMRTTPAGGSEAKKGATISVYVSKGPELLTVPEVRGKLEDEAKDILTGKGFTVDVVVIDGVSPADDSKVLSQDPGAGEQLNKKNAKITISVGRAAP